MKNNFTNKGILARNKEIHIFLQDLSLLESKVPNLFYLNELPSM